MASYTRQSTFSDGDLITAALFNDEYNQLLAAFENTTGHKHDGTVGEGPVIGILGDAGVVTPLNKILIDTTTDHIEFWIDVSGTSTQQLYIADGAIVPVTDNDIDLGTSSLQFKDLYINGTANIDSLVADTADINGGTIDGTIIGGTSAAAITGTTITGTSFVIGSASIDETELEILDGATLTTTELNYVDGVTSSIQTQIDTKAPLASPSLTGIPTAPTAASNTNTTQIATTAYVQTEITELIAGAPGTLDTLNELAAAINDDANYNTTLTTALATKLPLAGGTMTGDVTYSDNVKAQFGTSNDLQIYHDGSHSYIKENGTGGLYIAGQGNITLTNSAGDETYAQFTANSSVKLYHDNSIKLSTASTGVDVTGTITADALTVDDITINGSTISDGGSITIDTEGDFIVDSEGDVYLDAAGNDWNLNSAGTNVLKVTNTSGDISIKSMTSDKDLIFKGVDGGSTVTALTLDMSDAGKALFNAGANFGSGIDVTGNVVASGSGAFGGTSSYTSDGKVHAIDKIGIGSASNLNPALNRWSLRARAGGVDGAFDIFDARNSQSRLLINSSGNIGINTDSPTTPLHVYHATTDTVANFQSGDNSVAVNFTALDNSMQIATSNTDGILKNNGAGSLRFFNNGSEAARIDGSQNFMVGKTTAGVSTTGVELRNYGQILATRSGNYPLLLNRTTSDGDIIQLRKDGTTVGSIGAESSKLNIGNGDTGIEFNAVQNAIIPHNQTSNANVDNSIDLGFSSLRFKDLYLAGTANFGSLSDGTITITGFADEDDMSSNSATLVPTQQSVKAYVDSQVSSAGGSGISFADDEKAKFGDGLDLEIYHDSSTNDSIITESGAGNLVLQGNSLRLTSVSGVRYLQGNSGAEVNLWYAGSKKLETTSTGIDVTGVITTDGLTTSADINFGDDDKAVFGAGSDLQIYHSSADNSSYIRELGAGNLKILGDNVAILNAAGTENQIFSASDGGVYLYHNGVAKFQTTSTGIDVTGTVTSDELTVNGNINKNSNYNITQFYKADGSTRLAYILFRDDSPNYFEYNDTDTQPLYFINNNKKVLGLESNSDISFYNTAGTSQALFFDASTERLGIGTTSPRATLDLGSGSGDGTLSNTPSDYQLILEAAQSTTGDIGRNLGFANSTNNVSAAINSYDAGTGLTNGLVFATAASGTLTEAMRIDGAQRVGIGTNSPNTNLHVYDASGGATLKIESNTANAYDSSKIQLLGGNLSTSEILLGDASSATTGRIIYRHDGNTLAFDVNGSEAGRFDSSGNFMVGTTDSFPGAGDTNTGVSFTSSGSAAFSRDGFRVVSINRNTSDGDILEFRKDGSVVGSINTVSDDLAILSSTSGHKGLRFGSGAITPTTNTGATDNGNTDLGGNTIRFNNLFLGGTANVNKVSVDGSGANGIDLEADSSATTNSNRLFFSTSAGSNSIMGVSGALTFRTGATAGSASGTERMRLDSSGNFGIGTSSPSSNLHIKTSVDNSLSQGLVIERSANTDKGYINYQGGAFQFRSTVGDPIAFGDTSNEYVRIANGNVGIGTTSPSEDFHISGDTSVALIEGTNTSTSGLVAGVKVKAQFYRRAGFSILDESNNEDFFIGRPYGAALPVLVINTDGSERARIDSSGNLLVGGTTTPDTNGISIETSASSGGLSIISPTTGRGDIFFGDTADLNIGQIRYAHSDNSMTFRTNAGDRVVIDSAGNLMVGKTSVGVSTTGSEIRSNGQVSIVREGDTPLFINRKTDDGTVIDLRKDNSTFGKIGNNGDNLGIESVDVGLLFLSGSSQIIPTGGNFGVSDGTKDLGRTTTRFKDLYLSGGHMNGQANALSFISGGNASNAGANILLYGQSHASAANTTIFRASGSETARITSAGNFGIGTTSPTEALHVTGNILASGNVTAFSDERLKENIETLQGSKVLEMRGVSYTKDGEVSSGVIAQEIEKVAPELVHTAKDEIGTKSVAYGNLVGYLIEAIKDQQKQINDLKERLDNGTS